MVFFFHAKRDIISGVFSGRPRRPLVCANLRSSFVSTKVRKTVSNSQSSTKPPSPGATITLQKHTMDLVNSTLRKTF